MHSRRGWLSFMERAGAPWNSISREAPASREAPVDEAQHTSIREVRGQARKCRVGTEPRRKEPRRRTAAAANEVRQRAEGGYRVGYDCSFMQPPRSIVIVAREQPAEDEPPARRQPGPRSCRGGRDAPLFAAS